MVKASVSILTIVSIFYGANLFAHEDHYHDSSYQYIADRDDQEEKDKEKDRQKQEQNQRQRDKDRDDRRVQRDTINDDQKQKVEEKRLQPTRDERKVDIPKVNQETQIQNNQKRAEFNKREDIKREDFKRAEEKQRNIQPVQPLTKERFERDNTKWTERANKQRTDFRQYRDQKHVFDRDYWNRYNQRNPRWRFRDNINWWATVSTPALTDWIHFRGTPRYYYYGDRGIIYYSNNSYNNNFLQIDNYNEFVNQAVVLVHNIPRIDPQNIQWMPLGVYTLTPEEGPDNAPNDYFTLAVSPDGVIGGVYFNPDTNQNEEIEGIVDAQSQRAVWKFLSNDWPIFETGLYNLTQDESTAFIHYQDNRTDSQLLIRLQQ